MKKVVVIGTGGLAREFTAWCTDTLHIVGYASLSPSEHAEFNLPGKFFSSEITPDIVQTDQVVIAIGTPTVREAFYRKLLPLGFRFPSFIHRSSVVARDAVISDGVIISPQCVVSPNACLQNLAYINFCCGIGHDCTVGAFSQVNCGSQIGGASRVGDGALIGSGSTVLQGVSIGKNATVGSGSVVFSRVEERATVMGNPAKRMYALER